MIKHEFLQNDGILTSEPVTSMHSSDFYMHSTIVDPHIVDNRKLNGLVIHAESFPGWKDIASLLAHIKFVRDHNKVISKLAAVANEGTVTVLPAIAEHFVKADVAHFGYDDLDGAIECIKQN